MTEQYIYRSGQKLRCGYTTGSCAAAASGAAAEMLISGCKTNFSEIITPKGIPLKLEILDAEINRDYASCAVKKDSGDDPDITNGILIYAKVSKIPNGIEITGGKGIGKVTKAGLDQPIGEAAINSVPRKMIAAAVNEAAEKHDYHGGFHIEISVPNGEETALKTYNPRMGIEGGISIIGTSGIVEPMSNSALIDTIRLEEKMRLAEGHKSLLLTLGNYSENFIQKSMPFELEKSVKCSNFIGDTIDMCIEKGFKSMLLVGHIGKLSKLGCTIYNTHSRYADGRMEAFALCAALCGAEREVLENILGCITTDAALEILKKEGIFDETIKMLEKRIDRSLKLRAKGSIEIGMITFSEEYGILCKTENADNMLEKLK